MNVAVLGTALGLVPARAFAQSAREIRGAAPTQPVASEPAAKLVVDPPLPDALARGRVVIQYRTENLHIVPLFGAAALAVSPRVGHLHVSVDDRPWVWADASDQPIVIAGLPAGKHEVKLTIQTANHQLLDHQVVAFTVPELEHAHRAAKPTTGSEPDARLVIDPAAAEPLSRGVVVLSYRSDHLRLMPVFGPEALAITPRIGHIHVTVDKEAWHWADASGNPVIVQGLLPGKHVIAIDLVDADHQALVHGVAEVVIPRRATHH